MTKVLVSGASGFIGRHAVPALRESGYSVSAISSRRGDVAEWTTWKGLPEADAVVHLAGRSFVPLSWINPTDFLVTNVMGTISALEYAARHTARFIFLSSYLYGVPKDLPIPETEETVAANPYALSKKLAEDACRMFAERRGVSVCILRPFNVYGPGQAADFLIPSILHQVKQGVSITLNDLEPRRDYVYVEDVARAIVAAVAHNGPFSVFNIGSGVSHSVKEVVEIIQSVTRTCLAVHATGVRRPAEIMDTVADITRANKELGWFPRWRLAEGIAATCHRARV